MDAGADPYDHHERIGRASILIQDLKTNYHSGKTRYYKWELESNKHIQVPTSFHADRLLSFESTFTRATPDSKQFVNSGNSVNSL